jgi:hypothetical protein
VVHTIHRSWVRLTYAYPVCPLPDTYPARRLPSTCPVCLLPDTYPARRLPNTCPVCPLPDTYPARRLPNTCPVHHFNIYVLCSLWRIVTGNMVTVNGFKLCLDFVTKGHWFLYKYILIVTGSNHDSLLAICYWHSSVFTVPSVNMCFSPP